MMEFGLACTLLLSKAPDASDAIAHPTCKNPRTRTELQEATNRTPTSSEQTTPIQIGQNEPTCAPGQFLSVFPDVYPTDWAYQAVNRLSSRSSECFDLPAPGG